MFGPWLANTFIIPSNPAGGSQGQLLKQLQLYTEAQLSCSQEMTQPGFQSRSSRYLCIDDVDCEDTPGTPCHNIIIWYEYQRQEGILQTFMTEHLLLAD